MILRSKKIIKVPKKDGEIYDDILYFKDYEDEYLYLPANDQALFSESSGTYTGKNKNTAVCLILN